MKNSLVNVALLVSISTVTLTACSTNTQKQNAMAGAVAGAVLGGIAGSAIGQGTGQLVAIGVGAIAGGLLGSAIGSNMPSVDSQKMNNALDHNPVRKTSIWTNKQTGAKYTMTPMSAAMNYKDYDLCRKYYGTVTMQGEKPKSMRGIACRQGNGNWVLVN
jgi:surface antigen